MTALETAATETAQANLRALQLEAEREELRDELAALRSQLNSANDVAEGERITRVWMAREIQTLAEQAQRATTGSDLERRLAASMLVRVVDARGNDVLLVGEADATSRRAGEVLAALLQASEEMMDEFAELAKHKQNCVPSLGACARLDGAIALAREVLR